jgi:cell division protein FtsL
MSADQRQQVTHVLGNTTLPIILMIAAVIVGLAGLLPLVQSSGTTTTAGNISQLQQEREDWQARLQEEQLKVAQLGSLSNVDQQARTRLHMVAPANVQYVRVDAAAPVPQHLPSRFLPQPIPQSHAGSSLWDDIVDHLPIP